MTNNTRMRDEKCIVDKWRKFAQTCPIFWQKPPKVVIGAHSQPALHMNVVGEDECRRSSHIVKIKVKLTKRNS